MKPATIAAFHVTVCLEPLWAGARPAYIVGEAAFSASWSCIGLHCFASCTLQASPFASCAPVARQVLHGRQLGIDCIVILEQYAELATLLEAAARLGVQPAIGVRARLSTHHGGCASATMRASPMAYITNCKTFLWLCPVVGSV